MIIDVFQQELDKIISDLKRAGHSKYIKLDNSIEGDNIVERITNHYNNQGISIDIKRCKRGTYDVIVWW